METTCSLYFADKGIDITPRNVLLSLDGVDAWSTEKLFQQLGRPNQEDVFLRSGQKPRSSAPRYAVEPVSFSSIKSDNLSDQIMLIDMGEAFQESSPPTHGVGTPLSYAAPELLLEKKAGQASDIWALACTMFELRSGFPLFESFIGQRTEILQEMVRILGAPPKSSRGPWEQNGVDFGDHKDEEVDGLTGQVQDIGASDQELSFDCERDDLLERSPLLEPIGSGISKLEATRLIEFLRRALDYAPENRLCAKEMIDHPWLKENMEVD